jgi:antitoxin MazE
MPRAAAKSKPIAAPATVTAKIVRIGNSRGLRIPKVLLEQAGITENVTLTVQDGALVVKPKRGLREGWREALIAAGAGSEELLWPDDMENEFDRTEWTW